MGVRAARGGRTFQAIGRVEGSSKRLSHGFRGEFRTAVTPLHGHGAIPPSSRWAERLFSRRGWLAFVSSDNPRQQTPEHPSRVARREHVIRALDYLYFQSLGRLGHIGPRHVFGEDFPRGVQGAENEKLWQPRSPSADNSLSSRVLGAESFGNRDISAFLPRAAISPRIDGKAPGSTCPSTTRRQASTLSAFPK